MDVILKAFARSDSLVSYLRGRPMKLVERMKPLTFSLAFQYQLSFLLSLGDLKIERWESLLPLTKMFLEYFMYAPVAEKKVYLIHLCMHELIHIITSKKQQIITFIFECSFETPLALAKAGAFDIVGKIKYSVRPKLFDFVFQDKYVLYSLWNMAAVGSAHQYFLKSPFWDIKNLELHYPDSKQVVAEIDWLLKNSGMSLTINYCKSHLFPFFSSDLVDNHKDLSARPCGCLMPSNYCHDKVQYPNPSQQFILEEPQKNTPKKGKKKKKVPQAPPAPTCAVTISKVCTKVH